MSSDGMSQRNPQLQMMAGSILASSKVQGSGLKANYNQYAAPMVNSVSKRSKKASQYSLNRCDITLSEDNEAPTRIAGPGNLPFNNTA